MRWQYAKDELRSQTRFSPSHDITMSCAQGNFTESEIQILGDLQWLQKPGIQVIPRHCYPKPLALEGTFVSQLEAKEIKSTDFNREAFSK